jgi:hypothetical protein
MKQYIYYNKFDSKQEPQGVIEADNKEQAILMAAIIKQMLVDDFLNVFEVKEDERGKVQKSK